jgi:predicted dehydrogenase
MRRRKTTKKALHWGVAGLGGFSERTFLPALQFVRKAKLVSVYSHDHNRAKHIASRFAASGAFDSYDDFLASNIDAVYIGSRNSDHHMQVIKAAEAGKHILCDKPLALNAKQAQEMVDAAKANNVQLAVNYVFRFHPFIQKAKEFIDNKSIGKFVNIKASFNINFVPGDNFRYNKAESGGGALRDLGTHIIDLFRFLGGEFTFISGASDTIIYKTEVDDFTSGLLRFQNSGYGTFDVSYNSPKSFNRIEIIGSKGALSIENMLGNKIHSAKLTILFEGETKKTFRKRANKMQRLLKSVNRSFLLNETPAVTGDDGLINMRLMEALESICSSTKN